MTGKGTPRADAAHRSLEHVARVLEQAQTDPAAVIAREFVIEARTLLEMGDPPHALRSLAAARLALRYVGQERPALHEAASANGVGAPPGGRDGPSPATGFRAR